MDERRLVKRSLFLTPDQDDVLGRRAEQAFTSKSAVLRQIVDRALRDEAAREKRRKQRRERKRG